jgi:hypothetical protein
VGIGTYIVVIGRTMLASRCKVDDIRLNSLDYTSSKWTAPPRESFITLIHNFDSMYN